MASKVTIVGPGKVGATVAFSLMLRELAQEIVLIGRDRRKAEGEALDMMHAQTFLSASADIRAGGVEDSAGSDILVICASVPTPSDITDRDILADGNAALLREILPPMAALSPDSIIVVVSNPVDSLTWLAAKLTGFPASRVLGTGTLVDSIRFRELLSKTVKVHPDDLRAYILGEHGEGQFPVMSVARVGGESLDDTPERRALASTAKAMGIDVFKKKGNTCYAISQTTCYLLASILRNEHRTMPVSVQMDGYLGIEGVCLSMPVVVGKRGIERIFHPKLSDEEVTLFHRAALRVRRVIDRIAN